MNKFSYTILGFLAVFFISCKTTKRPYPTAYYQCDKCGEAFEISKSIDEKDLTCPDKSCAGKVQKVASYKKYGSGLNTRYGYSDPWEVGYSGPYVGSRGFFGGGFYRGGHHHHYYHDDKHSKSGSKNSNRPPSRRIVNSDNSNSNSPPMRRLHSGSSSGNAPSNSSKGFSRSIPSRSSNSSSGSSPSRSIPSRSSSSSSGSPSRSIPSRSSSSSSKGSSGRSIKN